MSTTAHHDKHNRCNHQCIGPEEHYIQHTGGGESLSLVGDGVESCTCVIGEEHYQTYQRDDQQTDF